MIVFSNQTQKVSIVFITLLILGALALARTIATYDGGSITYEDIVDYNERNNLALPLSDEWSPEMQSIVDQILDDMAFNVLYEIDSRKSGESLGPVESLHFHFLLSARAFDLVKFSFMDAVHPSEAQIKEYYDDHINDFAIPEIRTISILYQVHAPNEEAKKKQIESLKVLKREEDFSSNFQDYVKKHSQLPNSVSGGVAQIKRGQYGKTIEEKSFSLKEGEVSEIFETSRGIYIIKCLEIQQQKDVSLEQARDNIIKKLKTDQADQRILKLVEQYSKSNPVELNLAPEILTSPESILYKAGDFSCTATLALQLMPELQVLRETALEQYAKKLQEILLSEIVYQSLMTGKIDMPVARHKVENFEQTLLGRMLFDQKAAATLIVTPKEIKEHFEEKKGYYKTPSQRTFEYVLFEISTVTNNAAEQVKVYTEVTKKADAFRKTVVDSDEPFAEIADKYVKQHPGTSFHTTGMLTSYPPDWKQTEEFIGLMEGEVSKIVESSKGLLIFHVKELGAPIPLTLEQAEDKIFRVLKVRKKRALKDDLRQSLFQKYHFKTISE